MCQSLRIWGVLVLSSTWFAQAGLARGPAAAGEPPPRPGIVPPALDEDFASAAPHPDGFAERETTHAQEFPVAEDWSILIAPAHRLEADARPRTYESIYNSIPYRRIEYLANPSYRHEATMEILFGQMRPTVIHRYDSPERALNPRPAWTQPYPVSRSELWNIPWLFRYGIPYLP